MQNLGIGCLQQSDKRTDDNDENGSECTVRGSCSAASSLAEIKFGYVKLPGRSSDMALRYVSVVIVLHICLSVCRFVEGSLRPKCAHCFVLSKLKRVHYLTSFVFGYILQKGRC